MNNIQKLKYVRDVAISRGYDRFADKQYYVAEGRRNKSDKPYIAFNTHHAFLWEPEWLKALFGEEPTNTGWVDIETKETIILPAFAYHAMVMARLRVEEQDVIDYLYRLISKEEQEHRVEERGIIEADEKDSARKTDTRVPDEPTASERPDQERSP